MNADQKQLEEIFLNKNYFFRAVTFHQVGTVVEVKGNLLKLKDASWVADSGRFSTAIKEGTLSEVEYVGEMWVNLDTVVDFIEWKHKLPAE